MSIIYVLIPIAAIFVALAIGIFFWAVRSDQFEDLERQGMNVLLDDDEPTKQKNHEQASQQTVSDRPKQPKQPKQPDNGKSE